MYRNNLWECTVASTLCYYSICPDCGKVNVNTTVEKIEDENGEDFVLNYKCTECGKKYDIPFKDKNGNMRNFVGMLMPQTYCMKKGKEGRVHCGIVVTPKEVVMMAKINGVEKQKFLKAKDIIICDGIHPFINLPDIIEDISDAIKYDFKWQIESCPVCHKMNVANNIKGMEKANAYSEFTCSCGEEYKMRRYTATKRHGKLYRPRLEGVKELYNRKNKKYFGIEYNGGYLINIDGITHFVEKRKLFEKN